MPEHTPDVSFISYQLVVGGELPDEVEGTIQNATYTGG